MTTLPPRRELALIVVEYPDGRVAVQAVQGNAEASRMFDDCSKADADIRMSLVCMDFDDQGVPESPVLRLSGKSKKVKNNPGWKPATPF